MCKYCEEDKRKKRDRIINTPIVSLRIIRNNGFNALAIKSYNLEKQVVDSYQIINYCPKCRKEAGRVIEIIKDILFTIVLITGSLCVIMILLCALYRCFCIFLDHMKNANVLRKCMMIYIKRKRPDIKLELEQIDIKRQAIHLKKEEISNDK